MNDAQPTETLAEAFMRERDRVRNLLTRHRYTGHRGHIGTQLLELALKHADDAMVNGDAAAMLRSYKELKGCQ